jgi:hypothetical protein
LPDDAHSEGLSHLLDAAKSTNGRAGAPPVLFFVEEALVTGSESLVDSATVLCELALAHLLPRLAGKLTTETWWALLDTLSDRARGRTPTSMDESSSGHLVWSDQVRSGELPLTLAYLFPELQQCRELASLAGITLSEGLIGLTDGEGLVHARHLAWLRPLLACWTRCCGMANTGGFHLLSDDAQIQYEWLVRQALRLTRDDGSQLLGAGTACRWQPELFRAALAIAGDAEDMAAASIALPADAKVNKVDELPCEASVESEWSELAVLRADWSRRSPRLAVDFSGPDVRIELESGGETLLSGEWMCEALADGAPLALEAAWQEVCWFSDDDVEYLEISAELVGGGCVERQILLAKEDYFLYLCDSILEPPHHGISYKSVLPLAAGATLTFDEATREAVICGRKPRAVVLPLALPEWRVDPRFGALESRDGEVIQLSLCQATAGNRLACPLFVDLLPRRFEAQRTWRQLTVAESLAICPRETAVAYRVQCNKAQWIFYRSLAPAANRTFLGQNVSTEFFAARFHRDGDIEELLELVEEEA